jgi:hypothetical protein
MELRHDGDSSGRNSDPAEKRHLPGKREFLFKVSKPFGAGRVNWLPKSSLREKVSQETHMSTLRLRTQILGSIMGLAALVCLTGDVRAASPSVRKSAGEGVVKELHHAKHLLEEADHDYDGHRARAVKDVSEAIHELSHGVKHHGLKSGGKREEPKQSKSDEHLKEALVILKEAKTQLSEHEHHKKALHHVEEAIRQLHVALKIN